MQRIHPTSSLEKEMYHLMHQQSKGYFSDLVHDARFLGRCGEGHYVWLITESGSHMFKVDKSNIDILNHIFHCELQGVYLIVINQTDSLYSFEGKEELRSYLKSIL